jgi:hypothetical protein
MRFSVIDEVDVEIHPKKTAVEFTQNDPLGCGESAVAPVTCFIIREVLQVLALHEPTRDIRRDAANSGRGGAIDKSTLRKIHRTGHNIGLCKKLQKPKVKGSKSRG